MKCKISNFALLVFVLLIAVEINYCIASEFSIYPGLCPSIDSNLIPEWIRANTKSHNNLAKTQQLLSSYDFIVVGAGAAGSVIASRLSEDRRVTVLLIEAGGPENATTDTPGAALSFALSHTPSPYDWHFLTQPAVNGTFLNTFPDGKVVLQRGKALGGSSVINGMAYFRGSPQVYNYWEKLGATGWSWKNVFPYFLRSEGNKDPNFANNGYHNSRGPLPVTSNARNTTSVQYLIDACNQLGFPTIDLNGKTRIGTNFAQQTLVNGTRASSSKAFLEPVINQRPNLHILAHSYVTKVLFTRTKRAIGVQYQRNVLGFNKTFTAIANKEVILSAGVIKSPQILLLSGVGPKKNLRKYKIPIVAELNGVGQNLRDHAYVFGPTFSLPKTGNIYETCNQYIYNRSGPLSHFDLAICNANSTINNDFDWNDIQINFGNITLTLPADYVESVTQLLLFVCNVRPKSVGYLELQSIDPLDQPYIQPNYLTNYDDIKVLVDGLRWTFRIAQTNSFAGFGNQAIENLTPGCEDIFSVVSDSLYPNMSVPSDEYLECVTRHMNTPGLHLVGTCVMGLNGNPMSVVNPRLQVLGGVKGLRVADSSVMPRPPNANTYIPSVMIGERAAQFIKDDYNLK